jgi:hypothetical protein
VACCSDVRGAEKFNFFNHVFNTCDRFFPDSSTHPRQKMALALLLLLLAVGEASGFCHPVFNAHGRTPLIICRCTEILPPYMRSLQCVFA